MIRIEIEDNLAALHEFRVAVDKQLSFWNARHMADMQRGDALSNIQLPTFSHRIWETLTPSIPIGLNENEIRDVYRFYAQLDELRRLKGISHDPRSQWQVDVENVINNLLEKDNPLGGQVAIGKEARLIPDTPPKKSLEQTAQ